MYTPPFSLSAKAVNLIAEIYALLEHFNIKEVAENELRLRKVNRIKTIHSSLAIEGNNLTEGQVRDIINGKTVVAPIREIQEVKNSIKVYDIYDTLNAFKEKDLLRAHSLMMEALIDVPGRYRSGGVGVYDENGLVHMAPSPHMVPKLMGDLFEWLAKADDNLLVRSCVFQYEFEFIHPFMDGNGRTGRLWQSLILGKLNPVFSHLPVENMVYANQQAYYDAIAVSSTKGDSGPFIEFMLGEIAQTLKDCLKKQNSDVGNGVGNGVGNDVGKSAGNKRPLYQKLPITDRQKQICDMIIQDHKITAKRLSESFGVSTRSIERDLAILQKAGVIIKEGKTKDAIWKIKD